MHKFFMAGKETLVKMSGKLVSCMLYGAPVTAKILLAINVLRLQSVDACLKQSEPTLSHWWWNTIGGSYYRAPTCRLFVFQLPDEYP
jgi:hypothetical protein